MQVEDDHAEDDGKRDQDHGEHDVVDDDGDAQRRLRDLISQQQQEHGEGEQHVDRQTHLLSWWGEKMNRMYVMWRSSIILYQFIFREAAGSVQYSFLLTKITISLPDSSSFNRTRFVPPSTE